MCAAASCMGSENVAVLQSLTALTALRVLDLGGKVSCSFVYFLACIFEDSRVCDEQSVCTYALLCH
jgi:hypothetical protein